MAKNEKKLKKKVRFRRKKIGSETDTEIGSWFQFLIPKPNFGGIGCGVSSSGLGNHFSPEKRLVQSTNF